MPVGLSELTAFSCVATHRSFRAAAQELGTSPSGLSHAISSLEKRLGVRLFNRTTRSVALTEAGQEFLARVQPALHDVRVALESVNAFRGTPKGTLRINTSEEAARHVMQPLVLPFLERHPDVRIEIATDSRFVDLVAEGFDAGIRLAESVPLDMIAVPCGPDSRFLVIGSPGYFADNPPPASPADLMAHRCIRRRFKSGALYRWEFGRRGEDLTVDVPGSLTLDDSQTMVLAALGGAGLAYVSEAMVAEPIAQGRLVAVLEEWTPDVPGLRLFYPGHRLVPAALRAFADMARETAAHRPPAAS
jgi:DNA-binding transcriptional LysR family regulator